MPHAFTASLYVMAAVMAVGLGFTTLVIAAGAAVIALPVFAVVMLPDARSGAAHWIKHHRGH